MTDFKKEIDLIVRASIKGQSDLKAIPKTIEALEAALDKQTAAAKRGDASIDELKGSLLALQQVQARLSSGAGIVDTFKKLADQIDKSEASVTKNNKAYEEYKKTLDGLGVITQAQQDKLVRLAATQDRTAANLAKQREQYARIGEVMRDAGIDATKLAESQNGIRQSAANVALAVGRAQTAISNYGDTVRKAREDSKGLADTQARLAEAQSAIGKKAKEDFDFQVRLNKLREQAAKRAEGSQQNAERDLGLVKTANDAEKAATSLTTLARASESLRPKVISLRDAVSSIIDPKVKLSIDDVEKQITDLSSTLARTKGPVKDYEQSVTGLLAAQKALQQQSGLVDNFSKQTAALRQQREVFVQARAEVARYAQAVRAGGDDGAGFAAKLAQAQTALNGSATALAQQVRVTREARQALRDAGLATTDLAASQARLTAAAQGSVGAVKSLEDAVQKYGAETKRVNDNPFGGKDGGRTTLDFAQRLRGQILSLTATYVGLFGAIQLANSAIDATKAQEAVYSRLAVAADSNDPKIIGKEYEYLRGRAEYYGVGLKGLADSYSKYSIGAKSAGYDNKTTKFTFEQLTAAMKVMKVETDAQNRAFVQFQQILGKGKPEKDDLNSITESGFANAMPLMARGLRTIGVEGVRANSELADMFKLMKKGSLDGGQAIYALAVQAQKELGERVPNAIKSLVSEQGRFETAVFDFQKAIADSGFADAYTKVLTDLATLMRSEDGARGAQLIGGAFTSLAEVLLLVLSNIELLTAAAGAFILIWGVQKFATIFASLAAVQAALLATTGSIATLQNALIGLVVFAAAWQFGKYMNDNFEQVRFGAIGLVLGLQKAGAIISFAFQTAAEVIPIFFRNAFASVTAFAERSVKAMRNSLAGLAEAAGLENVGAKLRALADQVGKSNPAAETVDQVLARRRGQLQNDINAIKAIGKDMLAGAADGVYKKGNAAKVAKTVDLGEIAEAPGKPKPRAKDDDKKDKAAEAAAKKRASEIEQITKSLETLDSRIEKAQGDSLDAQLKAVDLQYADLSRRITKLGGDEGVRFGEQFAKSIANLKAEVIDKYNKKLLAEQEAITKKLEDAEVASGRRSTTNMQARLDAIKTKYADLYRDIEAQRLKAEADKGDGNFARLAKDRLDAEIMVLQNQERQKVNLETLRKYEQQMQDLVQARSDAIRSISDQQDASLITTEQERTRTKAAIDEMQPKIVALATEARAFAAALAGAFDPTKLAQFNGSINLAETSMGRLGKKTEFTAAQANEKLAAGFANTFDTFSKGIGEAINGQKSWGEAILQTGQAFLKFASDFLREIALMIIKRVILNSLESSGGGYGQIVSSLVGASVKHSGGMVGGTSNRSRAVGAEWFANAPRYHSGGMAGLAQDEYATILQRGEEVLKADSPRNAKNASDKTVQGGKPQGMRFVFVDDRSKVAEAMASSEGDRVIVESIRRNAATVRQYTR